MPCRSLCRWPEPQPLPRAVISLPRCHPPPPPVVSASHSEASSYKVTNVHWWRVWIMAVRTQRVYVQSQTPPGQTSSRIFCHLFMQHHMIFSTPMSKNTFLMLRNLVRRSSVCMSGGLALLRSIVLCQDGSSPPHGKPPPQHLRLVSCSISRGGMGSRPE